MKMYAAGICLAAALGLTACSNMSPVSLPDMIRVQTAENHVVTVSSSEKIDIVPDIAEIVYGVTTQEADAEACQKKNGEEVQKVVDLLKEKGIPDASIQTSGYGLNPRYDWNANTQTIIGYEMNTQITVSDMDISQVGLLINDSVAAGINQIESIQYKSSQYDQSYQEALKLAVASARQKADAMAEAGGFTLDGISHIEEYTNSQEPRYTNHSMAAKTEGAYDSAMPVMPGEVSVEARISVDFKIVK